MCVDLIVRTLEKWPPNKGSKATSLPLQGLSNARADGEPLTMPSCTTASTLVSVL